MIWVQTMNKTIGVKILSSGSYVPEKVLTNFDLEKMVETSDDWISTRTGRSTYKVWPPMNSRMIEVGGIQAISEGWSATM